MQAFNLNNGHGSHGAVILNDRDELLPLLCHSIESANAFVSSCERVGVNISCQTQTQLELSYKLWHDAYKRS